MDYHGIGLLKSFPTLSLGRFPTPLQHLPRLGDLVGHDRLFVKRDDLTGLSLGGNKVRSLEFLLGDAVWTGADTVVTAGGLQSNLCSLTAAACAKAGLRCVLVHNDAPPATPDGNMLLNGLFGAESIFIGSKSEEERAAAVEEIARDLQSTGARPYVIRNGASTPLGALGYLTSALELHSQARELGIALRHVVIVGAMGGTASGFVYGASLLDEPFRVHVVSVEYPAEELRRRMSGLLSGIRELTGLEPRQAPWDIATIHDRYLGGGYAVPTGRSVEAMRLLAGLEGILLEKVYTSKTAAGMIGLVRDGVIPASAAACFIHTGGMAALFAQGPGGA